MPVIIDMPVENFNNNSKSFKYAIERNVHLISFYNLF